MLRRYTHLKPESLHREPFDELAGVDEELV